MKQSGVTALVEWYVCPRLLQPAVDFLLRQDTRASLLGPLDIQIEYHENSNIRSRSRGFCLFDNGHTSHVNSYSDACRSNVQEYTVRYTSAIKASVIIFSIICTFVIILRFPSSSSL
jgi:hypothetical protein